MNNNEDETRSELNTQGEMTKHRCLQSSKHLCAGLENYNQMTMCTVCPKEEAEEI